MTPGERRDWEAEKTSEALRHAILQAYDDVTAESFSDPMSEMTRWAIELTLYDVVVQSRTASNTELSELLVEAQRLRRKMCELPEYVPF